MAKALKVSRKYLHWVQNSVLEGEISPANYNKLVMELEYIMNPEKDSIIIYTFKSKKYTKRVEMGIKKGGDENIL